MSDRAQFIVLCEDLQAQVFIRQALLRAGANRRRIRALPLPSEDDGGAGEAYVVAKYPSEVKAFRTQNASASTGLVVHIDADPTHTVLQRHAQLAATLAATVLMPRGPTERIAELVPKRNIETWIYALEARVVTGQEAQLDETTKYRKLGNQSDCAAAAEAFADHAKARTAPATASNVPSLLDGLAEFRRLP